MAVGQQVCIDPSSVLVYIFHHSALPFPSSTLLAPVLALDDGGDGRMCLSLPANENTHSGPVASVLFSW